jgi:hypothetical protein
MFINLPIYIAGKWLEIQIYYSKEEAESVNENYLYSVTNVDNNNVITASQGMVAVTMQTVNNNYILKSVSPQLYFA